MPDDLVELGRIVDAYGIRGWVKIQPYSATSEVLLETSAWWLKASVPHGASGAFSHPPNSVRQVRVLASRRQGATIVAQLEGVLDRDHALALRSNSVWVSRSGFPPADDDEYYWVDLIGCRLMGLHDDQPALIGQVAEVIDNGAHAVLRVARAQEAADGSLELLRNEKGRTLEVLVPFVKAHVHTVDMANRCLHSDWPIDW